MALVSKATAENEAMPLPLAAIRTFFADLGPTPIPASRMGMARVPFKIGRCPYGIDRGIDTFQWRYTVGAARIEKKNVVVFSADRLSFDRSFVNAEAPTAVVNSPVTQDWNIHFNAFGAQDRAKMLPNTLRNP